MNRSIPYSIEKVYKIERILLLKVHIRYTQNEVIKKRKMRLRIKRLDINIDKMKFWRVQKRN